MAAPTTRTALRATMSSIAGPSRLASRLHFLAQSSTAQSSILAAASSIRCQNQPLSLLGRRYNSSQSPLKGPNGASAAGEASRGKGEETNDESLRLEAPGPGFKSQKIGQIEPRLSMTFTCTADDCGHRSTHEFAKRSYEKGIIIIQCPSCKNRHLIADRLGWFKESMEDGKLRTVEDLLKAKGEKIRKGRVNMDGTIEYEGE